MADTSEAELWGLTPNAPPANGQGPPPAPTPAPIPTQAPAPLNFSEAQRWGTEALPGQTRPAPYALDTGPPPVQPGPPNQAAVDDAREWDLAKQDETNAYANNRLSIIDYTPLKETFAKEQHPEWSKLQNSKEMLQGITNPKEYKSLEPMVRRLEARIMKDVEQRNKVQGQQRREQLARDDAPYQTVKARDETASAMETHVGNSVAKSVADVGSKNPALQREADYTLAVSPLTTMSKPKPGTDPKAKPDGTNRDYTPLRDAATDIAIHNRGLAGDAAVRAAIQIGTPGGGTDEKGNQVKGFNGRYGVGATNYKVIGRDDLDNVLVQTRDGLRLRIPGYTFRNLMLARQQGAQRARTWEEEYKKSQDPGMIRKAINWGLSVIPEKGF